MFVARYLLSAVTLVIGIILCGLWDGLGFWQIARLAGIGILALQGAVVVLIAVLALRPRADTRLAVEGGSEGRGPLDDYLFILPK